MLLHTFKIALLLLGLLFLCANARPNDLMEIKAKKIDSKSVRLYALPDSLCPIYSVRDWKYNRNNPDSIEAKITCGKETLAFCWMLPDSTDSHLFRIPKNMPQEQHYDEMSTKAEKISLRILAGIFLCFGLLAPLYTDMLVSTFH
jgi:hypothetical protein